MEQHARRQDKDVYLVFFFTLRRRGDK